MLVSVYYILLVGAGLLGVIVGSFLNALSFRFNTGQRFFSSRGMGGRSRCMHCGHQLGGLDLIPVISYIFLKGKCRYCGSRVSLQYPLVELLAGAIALGVYIVTPAPLEFIFWFVVWMTLLFVVMYDIKHKIIPLSCSFLLIALACVFLFSHPTLWVILAGPILALPLFLLSLISWGRWMGWSDSILELSLGAFLGLSAGFTALMLAFWSGAAVGIVLLALSHISSRRTIFRYTISSEIPFAPFLIFGAGLAYFFHVNFFSSVSSLF